MVKPGSENMTDWIHHHLELGFAHIYAYNNGTLDRFKVELEERPINGITVVDFPYNYEKEYTTAAYAHCYREHMDEYDWIAFIDSTDYIMLVDKNSSINSVFEDNNYSEYDVVRLNVVEFSDYIQFTRDFDFKADEVVWFDDVKTTKKQSKSIVNCKTRGILFKGYTPTRNRLPINQCLPNKTPVHDNVQSNRIKGVDVNKIDTSIMYITPNRMEIEWRKWKQSKEC